MSADAPAEDRLPWSGRLALHPALIAVYPVLVLWADSVTEVRPPETVAPFMWSLALAGIAWLLFWWPAGGLRAAAIPASLVTAGFLYHDRIFPEPARWWVWLALAGVAVVTYVFRRLRPITVARWTSVANVLGLVLVLFPLPVVMPRVLGTSPPVVPVAQPSVRESPGRDILYIIPDRYARADVLEEVFDYDNSPFLDHLEGLGFQIQDQARTNYPKTALALGASWNLNYLDDLLPEDLPQDEWEPAYDLLADHLLGRVLTDAGYEYIHVPTWFGGTRFAITADELLRYDHLSEFQRVYRTETAFDDYSLLERIGPGSSAIAATPHAVTNDPIPYTRGLELHQYNNTTYQFEQLDRLAATPQGRKPRFILAHMTMPHGPFIFEADGSLVPTDVAASRTREDNYRRQVTYLNERLTGMIDALLSRPEDQQPIIVIQADEGPDPRERQIVGKSFDWLQASDEQLQMKYPVLSAMYLPGVDVDVPEEFTDVNTWRFILDTYFGTDLGLLDNRSYLIPDEYHLYTYRDITDRLIKDDT